MPSSTSSSDHRAIYDRPVPVARLGHAAIVALVCFVVALGAWEMAWRANGAVPGIRNSEGLWARERRRIDGADSAAMVLIGSSRTLSNIQLDEWERATGRRPIQLALEGTSPMWALQNLADDPHFHGCLLVGVAPDIFFSGFAFRQSVYDHYAKETPSERVGQLLSMRLVEPWAAFYDPYFALFDVLQRQSWPKRPGAPWREPVPKLFVGSADRNQRLWSFVEADTAYQHHAQQVWARTFGLPKGVKPEMAEQATKTQIELAAAATAKLQARGVPVVFVRHPSGGGYLDAEHKWLPRERTWNPLMQAVHAPGVHFEDYAELQQDWVIPEWSHMNGESADRYTPALVGVLQRLYGDSARTSGAAHEGSAPRALPPACR